MRRKTLSLLLCLFLLLPLFPAALAEEEKEPPRWAIPFPDSKTMLWGLYDPQDHSQLLPPEYDQIGPFTDDGYAAVQKDDLWGVADYKGELVLPVEYGNISLGGQGIAAVGYEERGNYFWRYVRLSDGMPITDFSSAGCEPFYRLGVCRREMDGHERYGAVNALGETVIPFEYDYLSAPRPYDSLKFLFAGKDGKAGAFDLDGNLLRRCIYPNDAVMQLSLALPAQMTEEEELSHLIAASQTWEVAQGEEDYNSHLWGYRFRHSELPDNDWAIHPIFLSAQSFDETGHAQATDRDGRVGTVDQSGTFTPAPLDDRFSDELSGSRYDETGYTVERRLETDFCTVVLRWRPLPREEDVRDYELWLLYPEGEAKKLLLPSTVVSRDNLSYAPTGRSPDLLTLSDNDRMLTYLYRFGDKLVSPYYGTVLHEKGIYTYTVDLASGELSVIYTEPLLPPSGETAFRDVPAGSWFEKGVRTCAEKGIMVGTGEGQFSPEGILTDAECLTLALRLYDIQRGGSGQLLKAPESWGLMTLTLDDGQQISGYHGRFYEGWYRFGTSTAGRPNPKIALKLESEEEIEWAKAQSGRAATLTAGGASTRGTVELSWRPNGGSALYFLPDSGSDHDRQGVINATIYCSNLYPGTDQWWRDAAYTLSLLSDREPAPDRPSLFSDLSYALERYSEPQPSTRSIFAYSLADAAGELKKLYSVDDLPDLKWKDFHGALRGLYEAGVLTGVDEYGRCDEGGALTRAQAAVMVARVLDESQRVQTPPKALPTEGYTLTKLADGYGEPHYPLCFHEDRILTLDGSSYADLNPHTTGWWQEGEYLRLAEGTEDGYESSPTLLDRNARVVVPPWHYMVLQPTADGTAIMAMRGLSGLESWYLLSPTGEVVEELGLDLTWGFNEGVCPWKDPETGLYGYVDKTGAWVIPPRWDMAYLFQNGYALVGTSIPGRESWEFFYTLIDHQGKEIFPAQEYDTQSYLYNSPDYEGGYLFYFRDLDGKGFYLNATGELVPAPKYCNDEKYQNGYFAQDGVYYDLTGTPVSRKFDWCGKLDAQGRGFVGVGDAIYRIELGG